MTANLFTEKDLEQLRQAAASGREISLTRTLRGLTMTVSTCKAVPVWTCDMLIELIQSRANMYSRQYFISVEEMMRYI